MDPVRVEQYKEYDIKIYVWHEAGRGVFIGMYEIYPPRKLAQREVVSGGFVVAEQAQHAALESARRWIDAHAF